MSIQLDGTLIATTMRTPGNDYELAAGFCHTEGLLGGASIIGVRYCVDRDAVDGEFNIVRVETGGRAPKPTPRLGNVSSSCGWCGSEQLDDLCARLTPIPSSEAFDLDVIASMPDRVLGDQGLFARTGSVHAAAAFSRSGEVLLMREDVGRHNAVDKVIGSMLLDPAQTLPAESDEQFGLFVSGRASIEMVQKAWAGGKKHPTQPVQSDPSRPPRKIHTQIAAACANQARAWGGRGRFMVARMLHVAVVLSPVSRSRPLCSWLVGSHRA